MVNMETKGIVLYEGPSQLDGAPIVCIATMNSHNRKTGPMVQTWIMRTDVEPHVSAGMGLDGSVCGDCPLRPTGNGVCYVLTFHGPLNVYRAWKRGAYIGHHAGLPLLKDRLVRIGSYGDPAAVPLGVWSDVLAYARAHTGYTHQWRKLDARWQWLMASTETGEDYNAAVAAGWAPFHVMAVGSEPLPGARVCPASVNDRIQCAQCLHCGGRGHRPVVIEAHGQNARALSAV